MAETFKTTGELFAIIEEHREKQGMSQRDLSQRAGLSHASYWFAANRGGELNVSSAIAYADVLDLDLQVIKKRARK